MAGVKLAFDQLRYHARRVYVVLLFPHDGLSQNGHEVTMMTYSDTKLKLNRGFPALLLDSSVK